MHLGLQTLLAIKKKGSTHVSQPKTVGPVDRNEIKIPATTGPSSNNYIISLSKTVILILSAQNNNSGSQQLFLTCCKMSNKIVLYFEKNVLWIKPFWLSYQWWQIKFQNHDWGMQNKPFFVTHHSLLHCTLKWFRQVSRLFWRAGMQS